MKRGTQVYWTVQGSQTPVIIARGPLTMDGSIEWTPTQTEQPLDMMLLNAQGPMIIVATNTGIPNSGTPFTLTFTMTQVANIKSKVMRNGIAIGYSQSVRVSREQLPMWAVPGVLAPEPSLGEQYCVLLTCQI